MAGFSRWILRHKRIVGLFWLVVTVVGIATVSKATAALSQKFTLPGEESFEAGQKILRTYGFDPGNPPIVPVVTLPQGTTVDSAGVGQQFTDALAKVSAALPDARILSFASTGNRVFVSRDGRTTFAFIFPAVHPGVGGFNPNGPALTTTQAAMQTVRIAGAPVQVTGIDALSNGSGGGSGPSVLIETLFGALGALVILAVVFGSFLAILPLFMALAAIMTTFLLIWGVTTFADVSFIAEFLVGLVGLGVAIDYALLIIVRWREELAGGHDNPTAVQRAMETAGVAVIHSGTTVCVGLLALIVLPVPFLRSVGYAGALIPLVSVVVAVTLLPVLLATIGPWLDWPRRQRDNHRSRLWSAWAWLVIRRPWVAAGAALVVLAVLLIPAFSLNLNNTSPDALSSSGDAHTGLQQLEHSGLGPGLLSPMQVLAPASQAAVIASRLAQVSGVSGVVAPADPSWQKGDTAIVTALSPIDPNSSAGRGVLDRVRQAVHQNGASAQLTGLSAGNADFVSAVYGIFPLMLALIALVTFVLLARAFRSLLLPLKAVLLNLLSVGAAFGVLVLIWQQGHGSSLIWGINATGSITSWVPLMVFAFLFGLSMDYEVFILARMREQYDASGRTDQAIVEGIGRTG
ncbi:MAG: MMPL family transporter, partial [Dehalococcoidia bacterium]